MRKRTKKRSKTNILFGIFVVIDIIFIIALIIVYLPNQKVFNKIVNKNLYVAYAIYGEEKVNYENIEYVFDSELSSIEYTTNNIKEDSSYEKMILTRDAGNEGYKIIKTKIKNYNAYLAVIYDPSKVHLLLSDRFNGGYLLNTNQLSKKYNAKVAINGGRFKESNGAPTGYVIKDGKILSKRNYNQRGNLIAFDNNNRLKLVKCNGTEALNMGIRDAVEFGPFLIVDGKVQKIKYLVSGYHRVGRTIIAQREDGIVLFFVTDIGSLNTNSPSLDEIVEKLLEYGAVNAANLDGGASSQISVEGKMLTIPRNVYNAVIPNGRRVLTGWGFIDE